MRRTGRLIVAALITTGLGLTACSAATEHGLDRQAPAVIGDPDASGVRSVTLTRQAYDRLGVETVPVRTSQASGPIARTSPAPGVGLSGLVPYSAVLYDTTGVTWVYTMSQPLRFVRQQVVVERVTAADAILSDGPVAGTPVVSKGVAELYGAELGVGA
jgi:hypothetical protein